MSNKFEMWAAVVVFVLFVLPTIVGFFVMIWQFTKSMVTGKPMPEDPREFYGLKKKTGKERKEELDRILASIRKDQEEFEIRHYGKVRERMPDPDDMEPYLEYISRGKETK